MDFALSALDTVTKAEEGINVPLLNLDGTPLPNANKDPQGLTLLGGDSKQYRAASRNLQRSRLERMQKSRGKLSTDEELDAATAEDIELLVAVTTGWFGILDSKGKEIPFSKEGVRELYTRYPVVREQAENAVLDRTRFTQPS
jgi:hypothetical protein